MATKKSFILYTDQLDVLEDLTVEQQSELFMAIKSFHEGDEVELSPIVKIAFSPFKNQFIRDSEKYAKTVEKRIEAGRKGGYQKQQNLASASKCKQTIANLPDNVNGTVTDTVNVNGSGNKRFTPPRINEVKDYISEKGFNFDPERFIDFYQCKDWMVGRNKMKDWKAAARNWGKDKSNGDNNGRQSNSKNRTERAFDAIRNLPDS